MLAKRAVHVMRKIGVAGRGDRPAFVTEHDGPGLRRPGGQHHPWKRCEPVIGEELLDATGVGAFGARERRPDRDP